MSVASGAPVPTSPDEVTLERNFDALIRPDDLRDWMKLLAAQPNHVSSPHDKANADQILAWFKSWGWDAHIETFWVLYANLARRYPRRSRLNGTYARCASSRLRILGTFFDNDPFEPSIVAVSVCADFNAAAFGI